MHAGQSRADQALVDREVCGSTGRRGAGVEFRDGGRHSGPLSTTSMDNGGRGIVDYRGMVNKTEVGLAPGYKTIVE